MTALPDRVRRAFKNAAAFEPAGERFALTTTELDATVSGAGPADVLVTIRAPTLRAAADEPVGDALAQGWVETFARRLEDAPKATRHDVDLVACDVVVEGEEVVAELAVSHGSPDRLPAIAKAVVEYAEGTYVEGVVPGFDYGEPVATLLGRATRDGEGDRGGTPL